MYSNVYTQTRYQVPSIISYLYNLLYISVQSIMDEDISIINKLSKSTQRNVLYPVGMYIF